MELLRGSRYLASLAGWQAGLLRRLLRTTSSPSPSARGSEEAGEGGSQPLPGTGLAGGARAPRRGMLPFSREAARVVEGPFPA